MIHKISKKESVELRNSIFLERGLPALEENGFSKSPYSTAWFGRDNLRGYTYEMCRLRDGSLLDMITINIMYGDQWIQEHINIFKLSTPPSSLSALDGLNGLQFYLPPNSISSTRLAPPRGIIFASFPQHKLRLFLTRRGLNRRAKQLGGLLEKDLRNIDNFIDLWFKEHQPRCTDWQGHFQ